LKILTLTIILFQFEAIGGTGNYQFTLNGETNTTGLFENLVADDYTMNLTDGNGCTSFLTVTLTEPIAISVELLTVENTLCNGENSGTISVSATGGIGQIEFSLGNETNTTGTFENLNAGAYNITIKDENNCQYFINVTVDEPNVIDIQIFFAMEIIQALLILPQMVGLEI
jgi:hypothetical protein